MKIILNNKELDAIDMSFSDLEITFPWESGRDHYRLLSFLSTLFNEKNIFDIGTRRGGSACALAMNKNNTVHSFDVANTAMGSYDNIKFHVGNILTDEKLAPLLSLLNSSPLISLDTEHDGIFEHQFLDYLRKHNYKGILYLDDINTDRYPKMREVWSSIEEKKVDVTKYGHFSGSGLVLFDPSDEIIFE